VIFGRIFRRQAEPDPQIEAGLKKARRGIFQDIVALFERSEITEDLYEDLEALLIQHLIVEAGDEITVPLCQWTCLGRRPPLSTRRQACSLQRIAPARVSSPVGVAATQPRIWSAGGTDGHEGGHWVAVGSAWMAQTANQRPIGPHASQRRPTPADTTDPAIASARDLAHSPCVTRQDAAV
jgi:hypothetical protein